MAAEQRERIAIESDADVVTARQRARELAVELEHAEHRPDAAGDGDLRDRPQHHDLRAPRRGVRLERRARRPRPARRSGSSRADEGPGIEDIERALQDGYTTGGGLGLGLPGARRLVDEFDIETAARTRARR